MKTEKFRRQHNELLEIVINLKKIVTSKDIIKSSKEAVDTINKLTGRLTVHLAMEDNALYPRLKQHPNASVRAMAEEFITEMGGLGKAYEAYAKKWSRSVEIEKNSKGFLVETTAIFNALNERIKKENTKLYAMVDSLEDIQLTVV